MGTSWKSFFMVVMFVVVNVECFSWDMTQEELLMGEGTLTQTITDVTNPDGAFCFIVEGKEWGGDSQVSSVTAANNGVWSMYKESDSDHFLFGSACVMTFGSASLSSSQLYDGEGTKKTTFDDETLCYLNVAQNWISGNESCHVVQESSDSSSWVFQKSSNQSKMQCGAQCVKIPDDDVTIKYTKETVLSGEGGQAYDMGVELTDGFCFVTYGASWTSENEHCHVVAQNSKWFLNAQSQQKDFRCGATCVSFFDN